MKLEWFILIRLIVGSYFLILFMFGLSGYLGNGQGFKQREAFAEKFGPKIGAFIHFSKVVVVPLMLGLLLVSEPLLKYFNLI